MTPMRLATYETYLTGWSAISEARRREVLSRATAPTLRYRDAMIVLEGQEALAGHLASFQLRRPGCRFQLLGMLDWGNDSLAHWQLVDAAGGPGFDGYDAMVWDEDRIRSIVGFSSTEKQRLR